MRIIKGTGDAKRAKGTAPIHTVPTLRCTNCGQQAMQTRLSDGSVGYKCSCGSILKTQKF